MVASILQADRENQGLKLDPRTKLLLLLTIAVFVLGGTGGDMPAYLLPVLSVVPLVLLLFAKKFRAAALYVGVYATGYLSQLLLLSHTSGMIGFLLLAITGILTRFLPSVMMGYFVVSTTTVSEFVAAMERLHLSDKIIIPMSVMFRFFPTVHEEASSINEAMRMRGISLGGGNPAAMIEYRVIPMMTCSVKIGEELSAAALTRGLGAPVKRTNICKIGFKLQDILLVVLCIVLYVLYLRSIFHV